jgi:hypothetical protein
MVRVSLGWLRGVDLNHRPLGYEILVISTTYKTRVALENPCKKRQGIVIGQLKDSQRRAVLAVVSAASGEPA